MLTFLSLLYCLYICKGDSAEAKQVELRRRHADLTCLSRLVVIITALRLQMSAPERQLLLTYLCPDTPPGSGSCSDEVEATGWEEMVEASITFVLKTALSKNPKSTTTLNINALSMPVDIETLKQRISLLFVKLEEGGSIMPPDVGESKE